MNVFFSKANKDIKWNGEDYFFNLGNANGVSWLGKRLLWNSTNGSTNGSTYKNAHAGISASDRRS